MGTNCLGPFLFNHFLEEILRRTAASAPPNSVRVVWLASMIAVSTPHGGVLWNEKTHQPQVLKNAMENYMASKAGNVFLASECAKRLGSDGIISISVHPGLLKTELQRHGGAVQGFITVHPHRFESRLLVGLCFANPASPRDSFSSLESSAPTPRSSLRARRRSLREIMGRL